MVRISRIAFLESKYFFLSIKALFLVSCLVFFATNGRQLGFGIRNASCSIKRGTFFTPIQSFGGF